MRNKIYLSLFFTLLIIGVQGKINTVSANPPVDFTYSGKCVGSPLQFIVDNTTTDVGAVADWLWDFGDGFFSTVQNPLHTYAGSGTYSVVLTIKDTNGIHGNKTHLVKIEDLPIANFSYTPPGCSYDSIQFINLSNTPNGYNDQWIWNFGDGSTDVIIYFPGDPNPKHSFPNPGIFDVTLKVKNTESCQNQFSLLVSVPSSPVANYYFNGSCEDQAVSFTDSSLANGAGTIISRRWDFGDPSSGIDNLSNLTNPVHIFSNPGNYRLKLIITNYNSCTDTITKQLIINPHPPVDFISSSTCLNQQTFFNPSPLITNIPLIATWLWDFGDGNTSNSVNPVHIFTTPGNFLVKLTVTDILGCMNVVSHSIKVDPLPFAHFNVSLSNCAGTKVLFQNQSSAPVGYIVKWQWNFGDGNSISVDRPNDPDVQHIYTTPGNYIATLTVTASGGCSKSESKLIKILPNPIAKFNYSAACAGKVVDFTDLTQSNGGSSVSQWKWSFGDSGSGTLDTSSQQNPNHLFALAGSYNVRLIVTSGDGCIDSVTRSVIDNPLPPVNFIPVNNCQNNTVLFSPDPIVMTPSTINSWLWDFGTGAISTMQNASYVYANSGTFDASLTVVDNKGCTNSVSKPMTVLPQPAVNFTFSQPACNRSLVQFNNLSSAATGTIVRSEWNFGDGNKLNIPSLATVSHTYSSAATFNVTLTIVTSDSCKKSFTLPVVLSPVPLADFTFQSACLNSAVQFNDRSQPSTGGISSWAWYFDDYASGIENESSLRNPIHIYNTAGIYQVTLITANTAGCHDTITRMLQVKTLPVVNFSSSPGCVNAATQFMSSAFVSPVNVASRLWNFGDGYSSVEIDPSHVYTASGSFTVTLTVLDITGCTNTKTHTVDVIAAPVSFFNMSTRNCSKSNILFTDYSSSSDGTISSFFWEFGDGSDTLINAPANGNVSHVYQAPGIYTVVLTVQSSKGCTSKSQRALIVSPDPVAKFSYSNPCEGGSVNFNDLSQPNSATSIVNWFWDFGDPASGINNTSYLNNPNHIFSSPGTYTVSLLVENATGCKAVYTDNVAVKPKPPVDFTWAAACLGSQTSFTLNPLVTNIAAITSFDWDFGDGSAHNTALLNPVHNYTVSGNYTVKVTIANSAGCSNTISHTVMISPKPNAIFSTTEVCTGAITRFADQSFSPTGEPITGWRWDFGVSAATNDTSSQQNPEWMYSNKGIYVVKLIVSTQNGCQDMTTRSVQVFGNPTTNFSFIASACENGNVIFQNTSAGDRSVIVSSEWNFEPNAYSSLQNPSHVFYEKDSCYAVQLIVKDSRGCIGSTLKEVCVPADFDFTFTTSSACFKDSTVFTPQILAPLSGTLVQFNWNFGDQSSGVKNISTKRTPSHYYSQPGTYTVSLEAVDNNNCKKTIYRNITIFALPVVPLFSYTKGLCDSTIYFDESSSGNGSKITRWIWEFGDGFASTVFAPDSPDISHKYLSPGSYKVNLKVTNANGCSSNISDNNIQVVPCLDAAIQLPDQKVCQNNKMILVNNSFSALPANIWYWDFGDGTHMTSETYTNQVYHIYKSPGAFKVRLILSTYVNGGKVNDTAQMIVNVNPSPLPDFSTNVVCNGQNAVFTNTTSGTGIKVDRYSWNFGEPTSAIRDTSSLKNPVHLYNAPGTYVIKLMARNVIGCRDSIQKEIVVNGLPDANFKTTVSCAGNQTHFTDMSTKADAPILKWNWTFKDNSGIIGGKDGQNPAYIFKKPGEYLINLMVTDANGCQDSINQNIPTWNVPESKFSYMENFNDVQGQLQFNNLSVDATNYHWTFGNDDYSYAEKPVVHFINEGTYALRLVASNEKGCTDTLSMEYKFMVKGLFIPTAFSPLNPKKEVRLLKPVGINLQEYRFEIYDRWGNRLWWTDKLDSAGQPTEGWDGRYKEQLMPEGVYTWRAYGIYKDGSIWNAENIGNSDHLPKYKTGTASLIQ